MVEFCCFAGCALPSLVRLAATKKERAFILLQCSEFVLIKEFGEGASRDVFILVPFLQGVFAAEVSCHVRLQFDHSFLTCIQTRQAK